jgi:hypothetical protein
MKGLTLLSAVALTTMALTSAAFAQRAISPQPVGELDPRTAVIPAHAFSVQKVYPVNQFFPAGSQPDPYIYLGANWGYVTPTGPSSGRVFLLYFNPGDLATNEYADDIILAGVGTFLPQAHPNSAACLSEITVGVYLGAASAGDVTLRVRIYGWDGSIAQDSQYPDPLNVSGNANLIWDSGETPLNYGTLQPGVYLLTVPVVPNVLVSKAIYISTIVGGLPTNGGLIIAHGPGNVYLMPSRGDFRRKTPSGRFVFTRATQGSFLINLRGKHNFVGQVDMSALSARAKPKDPVDQWFDGDTDGVVEALRRNIVDVEVVNDAGTPFTSRFTTYLDENGRFTLPVSNEIASITVRRWDNGLKVTFNRPEGGWSTDVCDPTVESQQMTFGDVNGDGIIDDADLLTVLFGFGSSE